MHDYDRRPTTAAANPTASSSKTTEVEDSYWPLELDKIIAHALRDHSARLDDYKARRLDDHNVEVTGTTMDGRTFKAEVYVFLDRGISTKTKITVEGAVDMGPVPPVLERAEAAALKLIEGLTSVGLGPRDYRNLERTWGNVARNIEAWRSGDPVDTKGLRSSLNSVVKDIKMLTDNLRKRPPEFSQLRDLLEEARKAAGAAARGIPDVGGAEGI